MYWVAESDFSSAEFVSGDDLPGMLPGEITSPIAPAKGLSRRAGAAGGAGAGGGAATPARIKFGLAQTMLKLNAFSRMKMVLPLLTFNEEDCCS
jgi:hypothetical protein